MITVFMTGATGYLGSNVAKMLLNNGYKVIAVKRQKSNTNRINSILINPNFLLFDVDEIKQIFEMQNVDLVLHLATCYGRNNETKAEIHQSNVFFPTQILELAIKKNVPYFINTHTVLKASVNVYSSTKHQFYNHFNASKKSFKNIVNIIPEYFYGPQDDDWKLITMILSKLANNEPSIDFSNGSQKRNFVYIDDMVEAFRIIIENLFLIKTENQIYIGSNEIFTIKQLAEICKSKMPNTQTQYNFGILPDRVDEIEYYSNEKITNLGWMVKTTIEEGIIKMINK